MEHVLLTGSAGFAGSHLVSRLVGGGVRTTSFEGDVRDRESLRAAVAATEPDAVAHLAGVASVAESFGDPHGVWDVNATGTANLLLAVAAEAPDARVLVVSSAEVYGAVPEDQQPIGEGRALAPRTPYGASKAAAEAAARLVPELDVVVARAFNHIGPGQSGQYAVASFAAQIAAAERGETAPVLRVGNLDARRDLTDVRDVVEAYALLLDASAPAGVYNVCSGEAHAMRDVLERLVALARIELRVELDPKRLRPSDIPLLSGDPARLREATGWRPQRDLDRTLSDVIESLRMGAPA